MIDSFNTTIKNSLKGWYYPVITGILSILTGFFIYNSTVSLFSICTNIWNSFYYFRAAPAYIFFSEPQNNQWLGWYLIYGMLILDLGIYLTIYAAKSSVLIIGLTALLRSFTMLGTAVDLKRHEHYHWGRIAGWSAAAIILSIVLIANPAKHSTEFCYCFLLYYNWYCCNSTLY